MKWGEKSPWVAKQSRKQSKISRLHFVPLEMTETLDRHASLAMTVQVDFSFREFVVVGGKWENKFDIIYICVLLTNTTIT